MANSIFELRIEEMKKISVLTIFTAVAIWVGSATAHPMPWSSSIGENNVVWDPLKNLDSSSYGLGGHQVTLQAEGKWSSITGKTSSSAIWGLAEPDNGKGGIKYYLYYWPRDVLWDDVQNRRYTAGYIIETNPIPEPATMLLLGMGLFGLARTRFHKKNK